MLSRNYMQEKNHELGQHVIYEEDGGVLLVEVLENMSDIKYERYRLKIHCQLQRPGFFGEDTQGRVWLFEPGKRTRGDFLFERIRSAGDMPFLGKIVGEAPEDLVNRVKLLSN